MILIVSSGNVRLGFRQNYNMHLLIIFTLIIQDCGQKVPSSTVRQMSKECEEKMMEVGENETDKYEQLLDDYSKLFHENHFQV